MRAHGAWVYLFCSIGAGALVGSGRGVEPALLVGTGFAGAFLVFAAFTTAGAFRPRKVAAGSLLAVSAPLLALWWPRVETDFLFVLGLSLLPALGTILLEQSRGMLARTTQLMGVATLTMAAPTSGLAGGATPADAALLFGLLWPFFAWRCLHVMASLRGQHPWNREELRRRGLREAAFAALWTLGVSLALNAA